MTFSLKNLLFRDEQIQSVEVFEAWEVRWESRNGEYSHSTKPEIRIFPKEGDAKDFKKALEDAYKLIKHTSGNGVHIEKSDI